MALTKEQKDNLLDQIAEKLAGKVAAKLTAKNPGFVRVDMCNERSGTIQKMLYGLYGLAGGAFLAAVATFFKG